MISDWTKPLRGSVSPDPIDNVKELILFIAPDVFPPESRAFVTATRHKNS